MDSLVINKKTDFYRLIILIGLIFILFVIIFTFFKQRYFGFLPVIVFLNILIIIKTILYLRWQKSYCVKIGHDGIYLNHLLLFNNVYIPFKDIVSCDSSNQEIVISENSTISKLKLLCIKTKKGYRINFLTLNYNERKKIIDAILFFLSENKNQ
ncbi:MAG TPA: hypothetical protein PK662_05880 [Bacteroidales bacterium]|nr:hypothetical protein [Bacteroidales bacterium]